jgi:hypothetical protein
MTLTKRQKVLVAVFVVGSAALLVDRVWLRPKAASADSPTGSGANASSTASSPSSGVTPDKSSVAQHLDSLWPEREPNFADVRDPFCLPSSWSGVQKDGSGATGDPTAAFVATHPLSAVLAEGRVSYALVGDRLLTPGQEIDGFKLVSVGDRFAVFEGRGARVVLKLTSE